MPLFLLIFFSEKKVAVLHKKMLLVGLNKKFAVLC